MLEDEIDISGEDSGSDKDWSPACDQGDSNDSDDETENSVVDRMMTLGSSGNRAIVHEEAEVRVYMDPPVERPDGDTDRDSDDSDQPEGLVLHFPRRILGSGAQTRKRKKSSIGGRQRRLEADEESVDGEAGDGGDMRPSAGRRPPTIRNWSKTDPGMDIYFT